MSLLSANLIAFLKITETKTVHGAAKALGITQTGVTQRIRSLESSLSTTLFTRSRRGMLLTPEGQALLRYCLQAKDLEGAALSQIQKVGTEAAISLCLTGPTSVIESRIVPQCVEVMRKFPRVYFNFNVVDVEHRVELLKNNSAQLAILPRDQVVRELDSKLLKPEQYVLVGSSRWKGRNLKSILAEECIIDFDPSDQMTQAYLKKFRLTALRRSGQLERHFVNNNTALIQLFKEGLGYGVLTAEVAQPHLEKGTLIPLHKGHAYLNEIALAWYPRTEMPAYFEAVIKAIR